MGKGGRKAELAAAHFYGGYCGTTRAGYPFFVERLGKLDLGGMAQIEEVKEAVVDAYRTYLEGIFRCVRAMSAAEGRIARGLLVVDLAGAGFAALRHVSLLQANGAPSPRAAVRPVIAIEEIENTKHRTYAEMVSSTKCKVLVLAGEVGRR